MVEQNKGKERETMRPFIYTTPDKNSFLIASDMGEVDWVLDLKTTLDWWISAPWYMEIDDACGSGHPIHT